MTIIPKIRGGHMNNYATDANIYRTGKRRKKKRRHYFIRLIVYIVLIFLITYNVSKFVLNFPSYLSAHYGKENQTYSNNMDNTPSIDKPVIRNDSEVMAQLKSLSDTDKNIKYVYKHSDKYSDTLLSALANNPEMAEFVRNYPDASSTVTGGFTSDETYENNPLFLQWDKRWGYSKYGDDCIGLSGCGPTCLSMVIFSLTGDETATPDKISDYSMENDFYVKGTGTDWSLMTNAASIYGITASELSLDESVMKRCIDGGGKIICAMRAGDFTTSGHFIEIYGYTNEGFMVNDPNSTARSNCLWDYDTLSPQIRNLWGYN